MKFVLTALAAGILPLGAQELKHLTVPTSTNAQPISVAAVEIVRELPYNSIIHLKGSVEIRTPVCIHTGPDNQLRCDGSVVLRADEADIREDTGRINASGHVTVTREPYPVK